MAENPIAVFMCSKGNNVLMCKIPNPFFLTKKYVFFRRNSLFAAGIRQVDGTFYGQDIVHICDLSGEPFAKAVSNYSSSELQLIKGVHSSQINHILGYYGHDCALHRDNISWLTHA